jgi:hypothetical protein
MQYFKSDVPQMLKIAQNSKFSVVYFHYSILLRKPAKVQHVSLNMLANCLASPQSKRIFWRSSSPTQQKR